MQASVHQISNGTGLAQAPPPRVAVAKVDGAGARDALLALSQSRIYARLLSAPIDALPRRISDAGIDVLVLVGDIERPATAKLLRRVHRELPSVRVVLASLDRSGNGARRALNLGADGFVELPARGRARRPRCAPFTPARSACRATRAARSPRRPSPIARRRFSPS